MSLIEKARLIQEVQQLTQILQQPSLTLFERAKATQRLKNIFQSCDPCIFQKQQQALKERLSPDQALQEYLLNSHFQLSFCGRFNTPDELQQQLKAASAPRWGLSYHKKSGWLIAFAHPEREQTRSFSASSLAECFKWLEQNVQDGLILPDEQLTPIVPVLEINEPSTAFPTISASLSQTAERAFALPTEINTASTPIQREPTPPTVTPILSKPKTVPKHLLLDGLHVQVQQLKLGTQASEQLYQLDCQPTDCSAFLRLYSCHYESEQLTQNPIYVGEQINKKGQFVAYLVLLGAQSQVQALRLLNQLSHHQRHELISCKTLDWSGIRHSLNNIDAVFEQYSSEDKFLWQREQYRGYVPVTALHTHKFIAFDEMPASAETPLILLKERQKIRVVHGLSRLQSFPEQIFVPYLMLDRQSGISWQLIQQALQELSMPVQAEVLFNSIMQRSKGTNQIKSA
ncbi:hypothetical protein [Acinetobacter sp. GSS19]|uniref:hypothetical protein n=1 Tax=Acinetobacter sp. GSS19 TaxID=3020716 RepID=UPI0023620894|nr:hypothetical protein [Acinetobacter sp. GSS19]